MDRWIEECRRKNQKEKEKREEQKRVDKEWRRIERMRVKEERKAEKEWRRQEIREEKRIREEQWKKESALDVEVSAIWPVIVGIGEERNQYKYSQIDLKY